MAHTDTVGLQGLQDDQRVGYFPLKLRLRGFKKRRATVRTIHRDAHQMYCFYK